MADPPQKYRLKELDPGEYVHWDQFVLNASAGIFYSSRWAEIITSLIKRPFQIVCIFKKNHITAGILFWPKSILGISAITPVPFTPYQGMLYLNAKDKQTSSRIAENQILSNLLIEYLKERFAFLDFPLSPQIKDVRPFLWNHFRTIPSFTYQFLITKQLEEQYNTAAKRALKKTRQAAFKIIKSNDPNPLTRFVEESYGRHALKPPVSTDLIKILARQIIDQKLGILYYLITAQDEPAAAVLLLTDDQFVYYLLSGINGDFQQYNPMYFLLDSVFKEKKILGKTFDFMGANTLALEQFKRSFGGELVHYTKVTFHRNNFIRILHNLRIKQHQLARRSVGTIA